MDPVNKKLKIVSKTNIIAKLFYTGEDQKEQNKNSKTFLTNIRQLINFVWSILFKTISC